LAQAAQCPVYDYRNASGYVRHILYLPAGGIHRPQSGSGMSLISQVTKAIYNQMDDGTTNTIPTNRHQRRKAKKVKASAGK
jgi:hypothetical protein